MVNKSILILGRLPALGRGKTRLSKIIGRPQASRFSRSSLKSTLKACQDQEWQCVLSLDHSGMVDEFPLVPLGGEHVKVIGQTYGHLGRRIHNLFAHRKGWVLLVGADCPFMTHRDLEQAFFSLRKAQIVVGPAKDGGFWLIGFRSHLRARRFWYDVRWSSSHTLADVMMHCKHLRVVFLRTLCDVDEEAHWQHWQDCSRRRAGLFAR